LWSPSEYDERQIALINYIYAIPFWKNRKGLGGWSVAETAQFQTGTPCAVGNNSVKYFTVNATAPPTGTFNLQPGVRDAIYGPGFQDWNLSLFKTFALNERSGFQFRAEVYDFPNHPNLSGPNYNPTASQFGEITGKTGLQRTLQLPLRFYS
jgi:hypothetical protein